MQYGWRLVPGNRNKVSFDAYGYQAVTTFEISEHETEALSAETVFSALPKNGSSWVDFGLILLCCVLVFILPEWCLGAIMVAAIIYVAAPIFLRNRYAEAEIRKFATSLMDRNKDLHGLTTAILLHQVKGTRLLRQDTMSISRMSLW